MKKSLLVLILFFVLGIHSLTANPVNKSILEDGSRDPDPVPSPNKSYKSIDVENFTDADLTWKTYLECIQNSKKLKKLNLKGLDTSVTPFLEAQHKALATALHEKKLKQFQMKDQDLRPLFLVKNSPLLTRLENMKSLESYDFSNTPQLPDAGFENMLYLFQKTANLTRINLSKTALTNARASSLLKSLQNKHFFVSLNLANNNIDSHILPDLEKFFTSCKSLTVLQLHGNPNFVAVTDSQTSFKKVNDTICAAFALYDYLSKARLQIVSQQYADASGKNTPLKVASKKTEQKSQSNDNSALSVPQAPFVLQGDFLFKSITAQSYGFYKDQQELYKAYAPYLNGSHPFYDK